MLTPDQVRLRLEDVQRSRQHGDLDSAVWHLIDLLGEVLPDLVAPPQQTRRAESRIWDCRRGVSEHRCSDGSVYQEQTGASGHREFAFHAPRECPLCTPEQPCERARKLTGDG